MTVEHERQLWAAFKNHGDMGAREELILQYIPFTKGVVRRCNAAQACDSFDDAISEAYVALIQCVDRFEPERDCKFTTLAAKRIRGAIQDFARKAFGMFSPRNRRVIPQPFSEFEGTESDPDEDYVDDVLLAGGDDPVMGHFLEVSGNQDLGELLNLLPLNWRLALLLRVFEDVSHSDLAKAFGFSYDRSAQLAVLIKKRLQKYHREGTWPLGSVH